MAAAEGWRDATEAACARHKVALFGWAGCKPRASMRPWTLVLVVLGLDVIEGERRTAVDVACSSVMRTAVDVACSSVIHACAT